MQKGAINLLGNLGFCFVVAASLQAGERPTKLQSDSRVEADRLVTGDAEHLNSVMAGTAPTLVVQWSPAPEGGTASNYPPGTMISLTELRAPTGGFAAVFNLWIRDWDTDGDLSPKLRTWQAKIDSQGYAGANANPSNPGCDLSYPFLQPCTINANCSAALESGSGCGGSQPGFCSWAFQSLSRADWLLRARALEDPPCPFTAVVNQTSPTGPIFAATTDPGCEAIDGHVRYYAGTQYLGVPTCANGTYTMGFVSVEETFFQDEMVPANDIPIAQLISGKITIVSGSCCTNLGTEGDCTDNTTAAQCATLAGGNPHVWREGVACSTACPACENPPCPTEIISTDPPVCTIDARYPHDPSSASPRLGFKEVMLQFNQDPGALTASSFTVTTSPTGPGAVTISNVTCDGPMAHCTVTFNNAIQTSKWTCLTYIASGQKACLGSLPADADSSSLSEPDDVLALMDHLDDIPPALEIHQCDIDRSTRCAPVDLLAAVDLLNGAGLFQPFKGVTLQACPTTGIP